MRYMLCVGAVSVFAFACSGPAAKSADDLVTPASTDDLSGVGGAPDLNEADLVPSTGQLMVDATMFTGTDLVVNDASGHHHGVIAGSLTTLPVGDYTVPTPDTFIDSGYTWTPTSSVNAFTIIASQTTTITLTFTQSNLSPVLMPIADQVAVRNTIAGAMVFVYSQGVDPEGTDLTYVVTSDTQDVVSDATLAANLVDISSGCSVNFTPDVSTTRDLVLHFVATDAHGASSSTDFTLHIEPRTVTTIADDGDGSLREALLDALDNDLIAFDLPNPSTITLFSPLRANASTYTLIGPGADELTISGGGSTFIWNIGTQTATISGLTFSDGYVVSTAAGGAISSAGTLTIDGCVFDSNAVHGPKYAQGGALFVSAGNVSITRSTFKQNTVSAGGGSGEAQGGAISIVAGTVTIDSSTFYGNSASHSTPNQAFGGAISVSGTLNLSNSTLSGNSANGGGAIFVVGTANLSFVTIANNTVLDGSWLGGGINVNAAGIVNLRNSIVAGNQVTISTTSSADDLAGPFVSMDYNVYGSTPHTAPTGSATHDVTAPPQLDALDSYGGPTLTLRLLAASPAVDLIPTSACLDADGTTVAIDQRGSVRPNGTNCDAGAYER